MLSPKTNLIKRQTNSGLYLLIKQAGKYWRFDYRFASKRKTLALGVYPDVSLADARQLRDDARKLAAAGTDPNEIKHQQKDSSKHTFETTAREWYAKQEQRWTPGHAITVISRLERDVFQSVGNQPIGRLTTTDRFATIGRFVGARLKNAFTKINGL